MIHVSKFIRCVLIATMVAALVWLSSLGASPAPAVSQLSPAHVSAAALGANLIVNGDAEAGAGSADGSIVAIPGWSRVGNWATVVQYGSTGGFPFTSSVGPNGRGVNFFAGGPDVNGQDVSYLTQSIDVSLLQSRIDGGGLRYDLQGYGYADNLSLVLGGAAMLPVVSR